MSNKLKIYILPHLTYCKHRIDIVQIIALISGNSKMIGSPSREQLDSEIVMFVQKNPINRGTSDHLICTSG